MSPTLQIVFNAEERGNVYNDTRTRPRAIKMICSSENDRNEILRVAKKLKDTPTRGLAFKPSEVFIGPDQTSLQRERAYQARVKRRQAKEREPKPSHNTTDAPKK